MKNVDGELMSTGMNKDFYLNVASYMLPRPSRKYCKKILKDNDGSYLPIIHVESECLKMNLANETLRVIQNQKAILIKKSRCAGSEEEYDELKEKIDLLTEEESSLLNQIK